MLTSKNVKKRSSQLVINKVWEYGKNIWLQWSMRKQFLNRCFRPYIPKLQYHNHTKANIDSTNREAKNHILTNTSLTGLHTVIYCRVRTMNYF